MKDGLAENIIYNFSRLRKKMKDNKKNNSLKTIKLFNKKFYVLTPFLFALCLILMLPVIAWSAAITMTWDRNQEPDIAGYRIYYGTQSGIYDNTVTIYDSANLPLERSYTVDGLSEGVTYYFALKTFDQAGQESDYSVEASQNTSMSTMSNTELNLEGLADASLDNFDRYPISSGDVNGDGLDDLVFFGYNGTYIALSNGSGFDTPTMWIANFTYGAGGWISQKEFPRIVLDLNGDNKADIIGLQGDKALLYIQ